MFPRDLNCGEAFGIAGGVRVLFGISRMTACGQERIAPPQVGKAA